MRRKIRHVGALIGRPVIDPRPRPSSSRIRPERVMNSASQTASAPERQSDSTAVIHEADSDDEVFHDARFPAEEEAVSWRDFQIGKPLALIRTP